MFKIFYVLCWIFALTSLVLAYSFADMYMVDQEDLMMIEGTIKGELELSKDIDYGHITMLTFYTEEDAKKYNVGGNLLSIADQSIYQLQAGDQVNIWIKQPASKNFVERFLRKMNGVWGLEKTGGTIFFTTEATLKQRKSTSSLVYMSLFILMALFAFRTIYRWNRQ